MTTQIRIEHDEHVHVVPLKLNIIVFVALLFLTGVTVAAAYIHVGVFNLPLALGIATFKATIIVLYFMHARYSSTLTALIILTSIVFLLLLIGGVLMDPFSRTTVEPLGFEAPAPSLPTSSGTPPH